MMNSVWWVGAGHPQQQHAHAQATQNSKTAVGVRFEAPFAAPLQYAGTSDVRLSKTTHPSVLVLLFPLLPSYSQLQIQPPARALYALTPRTHTQPPRCGPERTQCGRRQCLPADVTTQNLMARIVLLMWGYTHPMHQYWICELRGYHATGRQCRQPGL